VARFLSDAWFDEANQAAAASEELAAATSGIRLRVQQVVTGGPAGEVRYVLAIDDGDVRWCPGHDDGADVTFTLAWPTAVALATGRSSTQDAFTSGRLQLDGDAAALLGHSSALAGVSSVFADLRDRTTY
jgi:ubiquinone biosynthesis protein UbiJ